MFYWLRESFYDFSQEGTLWRCWRHGKAPRFTCKSAAPSANPISYGLVWICNRKHYRYSVQICKYREDNKGKSDAKKKRLLKVVTIVGTIKHHTFILLTRSKAKLTIRRYSWASKETVVKVSNELDRLLFEELQLRAYTCIYDQDWWVCQILEKFKENGEVQVKFFTSEGAITVLCILKARRPAHCSL